MVKIESWKDELRSGNWHGIPKGHAFESTTYSKAAPIFFVCRSKRVLNNFRKTVKEIQQKEEEEQEIMWQALWDDEYFKDVFTVYPYDRIGHVSEYEEGFLFESEKHKFVRVPKNNVKSFGDYIYW